ncbi:MAG: hypothetical protein D6819_05590, partial [Gammaproteobacteria bacterium]
MVILALALLRLAWRLYDRRPAWPPSMPLWERQAAFAVHLLLYLLPVALPLSGWVINSAAAIPFKVFWLFPLPDIVLPSKPLEQLAKGVHGALGWILAGTVLLHVAAALRHHFILRDDVLRRMLPLLLLFPLLALGDWRMIPEKSRLEFYPTWEGQPVKGIFHRFQVFLDFDPSHPERGRLRVVVDVTSADLGSEDVNEAIAGPEWFDFAHFPKAVFEAQRIRKKGEGYVAEGRLTLKGVTRPVSVPFTWEDGRMRGRVVLWRTDFGIGSGEWAQDATIGFEVEVRFDVAFSGP